MCSQSQEELVRRQRPSNRAGPMANSSVVSVLTLLLVLSSMYNVEGLQTFYYAKTCPEAEAKVTGIVANAVFQNRRVGAQLIRLLFHDCFVEGCDASILIDSASGNAEKDAVPNSFFFIFDLIDTIKSAVEKICPKTVSCADIIAFSAATSVLALGGPIVDIQGGRLDGLVSTSTEPLTNIPSPLSDINTLKSSFSSKGLNSNDLVLLSGAHTVGKGHCGAFTNRLYNFAGSANGVDPTLNAAYASQLQATCPSTPNPNTTVDMDPISPTFFDSGYFKDLQAGKGLFTSDAALYNKNDSNAADTAAFVDQYASNVYNFDYQFSLSLKKLGAIGIKTGSNGNIRTNCRNFT